MVSRYDDDEPIIAAKILPSTESKTCFHRENAPLGKTEVKVLLELTGAECDKADRFGLDLVTVLDVSGSMNSEGRMDSLKVAMGFLIQNLGSNDRLSIVTFNSKTTRLCPLRQMTRSAHAEAVGEVNNLRAEGGTDIAGGLEVALRVLNDRRHKRGRIGAIMLMTDGARNVGKDPTEVPISQVPVYTFGLGGDYDAKELVRIAEKSKGGTFSMTDTNNPNISNMSIAFSQCLGGLLNVAVNDLKLTIDYERAEVKHIHSGNIFRLSRDEFKGSVIISFGHLYINETRRVLMDVLLPEVNYAETTRAFKFRYSYKSAAGDTFEAPPVTVTIERNADPMGEERSEVIVEEARLETVGMIKEARHSADAVEFREAKAKLQKAREMLDRVDNDEKKFREIKMLKEEVQQLSAWMEPEAYNRAGRAFALASELSHALQRFASRGNAEKLRTFATADMDTYLPHGKEIEQEGIV